MTKRVTGTLVLAAGVLIPLEVEAQSSSAARRARDVERAARIGALVYGVTTEIRRETTRARRERTSAGSPGPATRSGGAARGGATTTRGSARLGMRVVENGEQYLGVPYKWGGNTPSEGFDCSGFVKYLYARQGVNLPRTSRQQAQVGQRLPARISALREGDLLFFASNGRTIDHVAMYAGGNRILHSSSSGGGVKYDDLDSSRGRWFMKQLVGARRVAEDGRSLVDPFVVAQLLFDYFDPPDRGPGF